MDPSVCLLRSPKVNRARLGAWLAKEELVAGLFDSRALVFTVCCSQEFDADSSRTLSGLRV